MAVLALAWLAAFNLRSGFIGLGPALPDITADLGLSYSQASFLVAVPTLMMGLMAVPGGALADRWGSAWAIALGFVLVALGGGLRAIAPHCSRDGVTNARAGDCGAVSSPLHSDSQPGLL